MKKLFLILVGLAIGVIGIAAIVGAVLPRDHVAAMTVTVAAPQVQVWTTITDPIAYPTWRSDVKSVELVSRSPLSWKEVSGSGSMTLVASEFQAPSRMVASIVDEGEPFGGLWEYHLAPDPADPNKTRVTITERGWVSNVVFRFMSRFVLGHDSTINVYLRALSRKFGPEATPAKLSAKDSS